MQETTDITPEVDETERLILHVIDARRDEIVAFARDIYAHGELGYKETRTSEKLAGYMTALGLSVERGLALTGVKGVLNADRCANASVALLADMDALRVPGHPDFNAETGGAHCCGHHAQMAAMIGAAAALSDPRVAARLDGQVAFIGAPAEEYGEIAFKNTLREAGKIVFGGGKCEMLRLGVFDDVDVLLTHHLGVKDVEVGQHPGNGFVSKTITYHGRSSHAAQAPERGINALSAASLGLQALALNRETFRDEDSVRVHPIMTKGGDLVNVTPETAELETLVRAASIEAIEDAAAKTDRSFRAGAIALGSALTIETAPGYLPTLWNDGAPELLRAAELVAGSGRVHTVTPAERMGASTDVGDVQHLKPVLALRTGGITGNLHQTDFKVVDEEKAYIEPTKIFALSVYRLLANGAEGARRIRNAYRPRFASKEEYAAFMERFRRHEELSYQLFGSVRYGESET